jgi:putative hydroxymethylpyrimidine transport system substrate-binding protein
MKKLVLLVAVFASIFIAACGSSDPEDIVVTLDWFQNANHAGIYEAVDKGYFEDEGLSVSVVPPADPSAILSLVASGESDFAMFYQPDLLQARNEGVPVVAVAGVVQRPLNSMMALKSSGITRPADLAGKKVGTPGLPWNEAMLTTMLEADGLTRDDVELVDVGWTLNQSLMAGTVDAVIGVYWTHELIVLENEGHETNVLLPDDWGVPSYYELILVASEKTVKDRPEMVEKFVKAFNKGYGQALDDPQGSIDTMIRLNPEAEIDEAVDRAGVDLLVPLWESTGQPFGSLSPERWTDLANWMKAQSLLDDNVNPADAYDASFAK